MSSAGWLWEAIFGRRILMNIASAYDVSVRKLFVL